MGVIIAYKDEMMPLPNGVEREELKAFKVLPNFFYVSDQAR